MSADVTGKVWKGYIFCTLNFQLSQNPTTNKPSNVFPLDPPQHLSSPSSITPSSPSLRPGSIFSSISHQLCPISSHLFSLVQCVIKFEQRKGWLSVCAAKQIDHPLISRPHVWQRFEIGERLTAEGETQRVLYMTISIFCHILTCLSSFDLVFFSPLNFYCVLFSGSRKQAGSWSFTWYKTLFPHNVFWHSFGWFDI